MYEIISALIIAAPPTIAALLSWRSSRQIHVIVNSQRTEMIAEIRRLNDKIATLVRN